MATRPYRRTCRPFLDGSYSEGTRWQYITHPKYAEAPAHYVRAFLLLLKDLRQLFDYIEPADRNLECYSFRIHELLFRACVEVEANCAAILADNGYQTNGYLTMRDYSRIDASHRLSSYKIRVPQWTGDQGTRSPFESWAAGDSLPWYRAYNQTKHDRHNMFGQATFAQVIDACGAVLVLLSAQFERMDFTPGAMYLSLDGSPADGFELGIGNHLAVRFPFDWPMEGRYDS